MVSHEIIMSQPLVIRSGQDFDKLGVRDSQDMPLTTKGLLAMDRGAIQDLLIDISGVIGIRYEEPFLNEVLPTSERA